MAARLAAVTWGVALAALAVPVLAAGCARQPPATPPVETGGPTGVRASPVAGTAAAEATGPARSNGAPTARLFALSTGGCCAGPAWAPDSRRVLFLDRPAADADAGIYAAAIDAPGAPPELLFDRPAIYSPDLKFRITTASQTTTIEDLKLGARWTVPAGGRPVYLSPGATRIAWQKANGDQPIELRVAEIWVAGLDGSGAVRLASLARGALVGWLDEDTLAVRYRDDLGSSQDVLSRLDLEGRSTELVRSERLRGTAVAPGGARIAYNTTGTPDEPTGGLWVVPAAGGTPEPAPDGLFGSYRWRDPDRLLVVPLEWRAPDAVASGARSHRVVEWDVTAGSVRDLTDPAELAFRIADGDWEVSPDGRRLVFVNAVDHNLWILDLR